MHVDSTNAIYGMYFAEAVQRWHSYPPPRYSGGVWSYSHPWLWYDGNPHGGSSYTTWPTKITTRMNRPSPVTIRMWGDYNSTARNGTVYAQFRNDSSAIINANVLFVVTEDSIRKSTPNGDLWHNHVARDYIPGPVGTPVSIAVGDSITYSQSFAVNDSWNISHCEIVAIIQDTILASDSTKQILQGAVKKVLTLSLQETENEIPNLVLAVNALPNPCVRSTNIEFMLRAGIGYNIRVFDPVGRMVKTIKGIASGQKESVNCLLNKAGVYFYRFESKTVNATGKIIVK